MGNKAFDGVIRIRGARQNNLKNIDLDLPLRRLIVVTGLSGSGKSSLAFETLYAEGQRRYIETFSPYARQFFDRMDKPQVDRVEGIPPAIAIEQKNTVRSSRSTVGTMTDIADYMKAAWPGLARLYCARCGRQVRKEPPQTVWEDVRRQWPGEDVLIAFTVPLSDKLGIEESLRLIARQGYQRLWAEGKPTRIEEFLARRSGPPPSELTVIQDRLSVREEAAARFIDSCEQAYRFGKGRLEVRRMKRDASGALTEQERLCFSERLHCAACDLEYREPTPALFSFNHPLGACPVCKGFGRVIDFDYRAAIPDSSKTLAEGAVKPWRTGVSRGCQRDLMRVCRALGIPTDKPFRELTPEQQRFIIEGDPDYGKDPEHEWPRAWYGLRGYFRWLESKTYKMHVRVFLSRYRCYRPCPECGGRRLRKEALQWRLPPEALADPALAPARGLSLADFYALPIRAALELWESVARKRPFRVHDPISAAVQEVKTRLGYLVEVGLGYLTLDRPTRTLSGGETERVNLTAALGSELVNTLYVLDEPSVGLHPRDVGRLVGVLQRLRDLGNTVVVVEHDAAVMRAADWIVDLGPGHGESGGRVVAQGAYEELIRCEESLTGAYLAGRKRVLPPPATAEEQPGGAEPASGQWLVLRNASRHNIRDLTVRFPLRRLVCVTGVSGSGKSTLVQEILLPALHLKIFGAPADLYRGKDVEADEDTAQIPEDWETTAPAQIEGWEAVRSVVMADQSPIGQTPRSTPASYVGAWDPIRRLFAATPAAREKGLRAAAFSFNSSQGRCPKCGGMGFEKVEMQFLSDVYIRCPECGGRRFRSETLTVSLESRSREGKIRRWNAAEFLEATVDEATVFLEGVGSGAEASKALDRLRVLQLLGLGYIRLGQPVNTLSGGECERLKLAEHIAASGAFSLSSVEPGLSRERVGGSLFLFDEPTTGLHFEDVRQLLAAFRRLVDAGHSVIVVEHNPEFIKCADWIIDLGPEAGEEGGKIVAEGPPFAVAAYPGSHTGKALREAGVVPDRLPPGA